MYPNNPNTFILKLFTQPPDGGFISSIINVNL
nr:MAG TPA: hypothetical protein [Caudoviricetes sp.]